MQPQISGATISNEKFAAAFAAAFAGTPSGASAGAPEKFAAALRKFAAASVPARPAALGGRPRSASWCLRTIAATRVGKFAAAGPGSGVCQPALTAVAEQASCVRLQALTAVFSPSGSMAAPGLSLVHVSVKKQKQNGVSPENRSPSFPKNL